MNPTHFVARIVFTPIVALALLFLVETSATAQTSGGPMAPGRGIAQIDLTGRVGEILATLDPNTLGGQPTIADFQHGWLYMGSGVLGQHNWIDILNPETPLHQFMEPTFGNKPHMITFWDDSFIHGGQGSVLRIYDFLAGTLTGSIDTGVRPVSYGLQPPYDFRGTNGYIAEPNELAITDYSDPALPVALIPTPIDLEFVLGFKIGATFPIGNLMIVAASQGTGVATFDISDPANPVLLDRLVGTGKSIYTANVYGSRLYAAESGNGIRAYDFSDPCNIEAKEFFQTEPGMNPRYVALKDGRGYCAPGDDSLLVFDAATMTEIVPRIDLLGNESDFVFPLGNMAVLGGSSDHNAVQIVAIEGPKDEQGPVPLYISPANQAKGVALTSRIGFSMSEHIDVTSLDPTAFVVRCTGVRKSYERAASLDPNDPRPRAELGHYYDCFDDDFEKAESHFRAAIGLGADAEAWSGLARVLAQTGRGTAAVELLHGTDCPFRGDEPIKQMIADILGGEWG